VALNLRHQTAAQFVARFRERFRAAEREDAAKMATWLLNRIADGDVTDTQVRNAFGLNNTQYNALKTRMTNLRTAWLAVQAARGE